MATRDQQAAALREAWETDPRWAGIRRDYTPQDVVRLRGSVQVEHTLARRGAAKLWNLLHDEPFVQALGALTGDQALQQVEAGLKAIYLSGDANCASGTYSDQSPYRADAMPALVRRINGTFQRADQVQWAEGRADVDFFAPIVADAEAGGVLDAFERMKALIEAGAAGVHVDDRLATVRPCGQMGGKVLVPTRAAVEKLAAARLAADAMDTPTVLIARTDAQAADFLSADVDANDRPFCTGERSVEGYFRVRPGVEPAIARALAYAPYADLVWCETGKPDLAFAKRFAEAVHARFPGKLLAYDCSPSFNWKKNLDDATIGRFQRELGAMGYKFQFIALAGLHSQDYGMFHLAHGYARRHMAAFVELQEAQFAAAARGFTAVKQRREVDAGYFEAIAQAVRQGEQFFPAQRVA
ncbi:isocitrate lyase [Pseudoduganella chitinolytica]|uniref:Isocitrate lyase n=1 Tax=Pseudoduganella chitinolytica TaxID=34070 RepID=A0ABY8BD41_9BURK|nr:isocitrate lyase [Pseudoduganella chitinolytica]WEF33827.1 isocitrate lyase [Pseudoduganella chitinolytica]